MSLLINVSVEKTPKLFSGLSIFLHESHMGDVAMTFLADNLFESWQECVDE